MAKLQNMNSSKLICSIRIARKRQSINGANGRQSIGHQPDPIQGQEDVGFFGKLAAGVTSISETIQDIVWINPRKRPYRAYLPWIYWKFQYWIISIWNHARLIFFIQKEQQKTYGLGTIKFSLSYDFGSQTLLVKIVKADNIPAMDIGGTSDPFVKVS